MSQRILKMPRNGYYDSSSQEPWEAKVMEIKEYKGVVYGNDYC